tara:strand:- start:85 stop:432 length:348 start_codon:yes stop_codon:yes gene_type:complete
MFNINYNNFERGLTMLRKYKGYTIIKEDIPKNEIDFFGGEYLVKERDIMFYTLKECKHYIDRITLKQKNKLLTNIFVYNVLNSEHRIYDNWDKEVFTKMINKMKNEEIELRRKEI